MFIVACPKLHHPFLPPYLIKVSSVHVVLAEAGCHSIQALPHLYPHHNLSHMIQCEPVLGTVQEQINDSSLDSQMPSPRSVKLKMEEENPVLCG